MTPIKEAKPTTLIAAKLTASWRNDGSEIPKLASGAKAATRARLRGTTQIAARSRYFLVSRLMLSMLTVARGLRKSL
jgi:hypothetical protein